MFKRIICFISLLVGCSTVNHPTKIEAPNQVETNSDRSCDHNSCKVKPEKEIPEKKPDAINNICIHNMIWVHGNRCTKIEEHCIEWKDPPSASARCQKYKPSTCVSHQYEIMNFCIDKYELHDENQMPYGNLSWTKAKSMCEWQGKRLCSEQVWGFEFRNDICNIERKPALCSGKLCDYREKITAYPNCLSPFLVKDMTGSVDEWIEVPLYSHSQASGMIMRSALMGGHYLHGRHRSLSKTTDHGEEFTNPPSIGGRCCKNL